MELHAGKLREPDGKFFLPLRVINGVRRKITVQGTKRVCTADVFLCHISFEYYDINLPHSKKHSQRLCQQSIEVLKVLYLSLASFYFLKT